MWVISHSSPQNNLPDLSKPHVVFSSVNLMQAACRGLRSSYTGLGHFVRASSDWLVPPALLKAPQGIFGQSLRPGGVGLDLRV